jgi:hypothetical protein
VGLLKADSVRATSRRFTYKHVSFGWQGIENENVTIPKKAACPRGDPDSIFAWDTLAVVGSAKKSVSHGKISLDDFLGTRRDVRRRAQGLSLVLH